MRGPPGPMGLTGRSGPVVSNLFLQLTSMTFHKYHPRTVQLPQGTNNKATKAIAMKHVRNWGPFLNMFYFTVTRWLRFMARFPFHWNLSNRVRCIIALLQSSNRIVCLKMLSHQHFWGSVSACIPPACYYLGAKSCLGNALLSIPQPPTPTASHLGLLIHDPLIICCQKHTHNASVKSAFHWLQSKCNHLQKHLSLYHVWSHLWII